MQEQTYIICDNQDLTRLGLINLLEQNTKSADIELAFDKKELGSLLEKNPTATIIIDLELFDLYETKAFVALFEKYSNASCLILMQEVSEHYIHEYTRNLSQCNIALKSNSQEELLLAITSTSNKKKYYCSEVLEVVLGNKPKAQTQVLGKDFSLTPTEREIVQLLALGKSTKEIANERCLSYHTVITHRKNIFRKMEVNTVHELTKLALKNGLVDMTEYYI